MDKATVALAATEDNAAAIAKLQKAVAKGFGCRAVKGVVEANYSKLGEVTSDGRVAVIAAIPATTKCLVFFNDELVRVDKTPVIAILPPGKGELKAQPPVENVYALILGEKN